MSKRIIASVDKFYTVLELQDDGLYRVVGGSADLSIAKRIATPEHPVNNVTALNEPAPKRKPGRPRKAAA